MPARPHQINAKAAVVKDYDKGYRRLLAAMATGTGKTFFFSDLYNDIRKQLPGKMLVLAHTEELVDQNIKALRDIHPTLKIDKEMAQHKADPSTADIIVASVASLGRKGTKRVDKYNWSEWDKIIVDEAHHTPASNYRNILEVSGVNRPETSKLLLGVTATTQRADGKALSEFYDRISYVYSLRQAIEDGWLVDVRGYRVDTETNLENIGTSAGDFNQEKLADKVNNPVRNSRIAKAWQERGEGRQTVVFAADIAHAKALADAFKAKGIAAEAIWGEDPDRVQKLADHRAKKTTVLVNVGILTEGYDDWQIGCIVLARPTMSECLFTQMCGRGTRLQEGTGNLRQYLKKEGIGLIPDALGSIGIKSDCIIIDVVDNTDMHSLMTLPSLMGLPSGFNLQGGSLVAAAKKLEDLQEQNPNVDFTKLKDLQHADQYIEQVNMFEIRFPEEVEKNSELKWYKSVDGGFVMRVPGPATNKVGEPITRGASGKVSIHENLLGKWEINGEIKDEKFKGVRDSMEEAFAAADHAVRDRIGGLVTLLNRKGEWHGKPLDWNGKQAGLLKKLYPGKAWPADLTKGQASFWIDKKLAKKVKG
jgi:superfamily II DNA or RNA helicase